MTDGSWTYPARFSTAIGVIVLKQAPVVDVGEAKADISRAISLAASGSAAGAAKMLSRHRVDIAKASGKEVYIVD